MFTSDVAEDFRRLLVNHADTFAKSSDDIGTCPLIENDIDTGDSKPIRHTIRQAHNQVRTDTQRAAKTEKT